MGHALFETQRPIQLSHDLTQNPIIPFSILHQRNCRKANEVYESRIRFAGWNLGRRCYVPGFYVDTSASRAFIALFVLDLSSANCTYHDIAISGLVPHPTIILVEKDSFTAYCLSLMSLLKTIDHVISNSGVSGDFYASDIQTR